MATQATQRPNFGRGGDDASAADEAVRAASGGAFRRKTHYLPQIGKDKSVFIRYITDSPDWLYANAHPSAPTKNKPSDWPDNAKWPEGMPAVCRYDKAFAGMYSDCYICDAKLVNNWGRECKPVVRVWALAVLREEVIGTQEMVDQNMIPAEMVGKRVGFKDATREVPVYDADGKETDQKTLEPAIVVVNKAVNNYFGGLQSMFGVYGSVCDRDYVLKQINEGKDVDFTHIPLDKTESHMPGTESWKRYEKAIEDQEIDLVALMADRASDEFFALFFDPNKAAPKREKKSDDSGAKPAAVANAQGASETQQSSAPGNDVDPERLAAMRDRVRGTSTAAPAAAGAVDFG